MPTYINPDAIIDHSITSVKLANNVIPTDASIAAMGYTKNTGTITGITMNGTSKGTSGVVNLGTVITDVSNLATKSAAIGSLSLNLDSTNYKITLSGTKVDGSAFTVQNVIDLPLESVVVDGSYNNTTKKVVLTLQNGSTVEFSVADLVAGLQSEITSSNKLSADLISDGDTNKTVTATEKSTWNTAVQPGDLATVATTGNYSDLSGAPEPGPVYYALASAADLTFTKWNASVSGITSYYNGLTFIVVNGSGATVELEGSSATFNVNGLGAKTISRSYLAGGGYTAQNLPANGAILLTYYNNMFYLQAMLYNLADFYSDSTHRLVSDASTAMWNSKQDAISDLATIRENASAGAAKVSNVQSDWDATSGLAAILHKPTIPSAPGTLNTNNTAAQTAIASEALSGTIKLHKIAKTGTYSDLIGTPVMTSDASVAGWGYTKNTGTLTGVKFNGAAATVSGSIASITATIPSEVTESTVSGWGFTKNTGTITGVKFNDTTATVSGGIASITATIPDEVTESTVSGWGFTKNTGTLTGVKFNGTDATISGSIASISATIPAAPGTLNTNNSTAQTVASSEALSGAIKLHKVAKTGTYSDLIGTPVMTSDASVAGWGYTKNDGTITGITMNGNSKGTSGVVDLGTVITSETSLSKGNTSGSGNAVTDIAVSGHQITLTKGTTFLTSHQSIKTINGNTITGSGNVSINELPTVTSSDNGKVLMVVNGAWSMVTPVSIYSGSAAPNNSQGINGDIYLQV